MVTCSSSVRYRFVISVWRKTPGSFIAEMSSMYTAHLHVEHVAVLSPILFPRSFGIVRVIVPEGSSTGSAGGFSSKLDIVMIVKP